MSNGEELNEDLGEPAAVHHGKKKDQERDEDREVRQK